MSMSIKKLFSTKKAVAIGATVALTLGLSGAAFAYFTASATGSGTATVGTAVASDIYPVTIGGSMLPGGPTVPIYFTIINNSDGVQKFGQVVIDPAFGSGTGIDGLPLLCLATDFQFNPSGTLSYTIAAHASANDGSATLQLNNTVLNQDACKGASPVLHLKTGTVS